MKQSFGKSKLVVYTLRGKAENGQLSRCKSVVERIVAAPDLPKWSTDLTPSPEANFPLAEAINKMDFDLSFNLNPCSEAIFVLNSKDSCGEDTCKALRHLQGTIKRLHRTMRIQVVGTDLQCKLGPTSSVMIVPASPTSLALAAARAQENFDKVSGHSVTARKAPVARADVAGSDMSKKSEAEATQPEEFVLQMQGPPVGVRFEWQGRAMGKQTLITTPVVTGKLPGTFKLAKGRWKISLISPSWIAGSTNVTREFGSPSENSLEIKDVFGDRILWLPSSGSDDQLLVLQNAREERRILIPKDSPEVPVLKTALWKMITVPSR